MFIVSNPIYLGLQKRLKPNFWKLLHRRLYKLQIRKLFLYQIHQK